MQEQLTTDPEPKRIAQMAALVAEEMHQKREPKGHGAYLVYDDGKLRIRLDTYVPNLCVWVILEDGNPATVYSAGYHEHHRPGEYHPGHWIGHLKDLFVEAGRIRDAKEAERETRRQLEQQARRALIDDSGVFP